MSDPSPSRPLPRRKPVTLVVRRADIERGDTGAVLQKLLSLIESPERAASYRSRVCLAIQGYEDEVGPPYRIASVRSFFAELDERFPYWFYFLTRNDDSLALIASLLTGNKEIAPGVVRIDRDDMALYFERHFAGLERLFVVLDLPEDDLERIALEIERYYFGRSFERPEGAPTLH